MIVNRAETFRQLPLVLKSDGKFNVDAVERCSTGIELRIGFFLDEDAKWDAFGSLIAAYIHASKKEAIWPVESTAIPMLAQSLRQTDPVVEAEQEM